MHKIMLCCSAGMSTSLLVRKMLEQADQRGLEVEITACSATEFGDHFADYQVVLLGPQIKYMLDNLAAKGAEQGIPVAVINMMDYGMQRGDKVLDFALELIVSKGAA
ncbi:PTS sugar transporter subunit IIB [Erwiniaceae bacterium BAC15a-03b]|uniref:PTS sugar transporter subunit IIB n=1 Tax=Winslowiella arboricola TaxID=2978220 RepID=A0A9J6Q001_9GAMM|nr:PTS sugar transporter subunit IIB [Winslowiella arboricola]MCU5775575.1 PTS sugar transporter subunit IIB [Winslowiella arboricola]MCU5779575.1 PTS sugar transporter subunit IIB [Winslowiella arboricola]